MPNMLHLGATLLVWTSIGAFQTTLGSKFLGPKLPCTPGTLCLSGQELPSFKPQRKHPLHPAKFPIKKSSSKDSYCLDTFYCTFVQSVESSEVLKDLFDTFKEMPASDFYTELFPNLIESYDKVGAKNVDFLTVKAMETITESFDEISADLVMQVYAYSIAKYLFTENVLTPQNAVQLAKDYADIMEERAKRIDSPYTTLSDGFVDFLHTLGLFTTDNALLISLQFANEWKVATNPSSLKYKCGSKLYS